MLHPLLLAVWRLRLWFLCQAAGSPCCPSKCLLTSQGITAHRLGTVDHGIRWFDLGLSIGPAAILIASGWWFLPCPVGLRTRIFEEPPSPIWTDSFPMVRVGGLATCAAPGEGQVDSNKEQDLLCGGVFILEFPPSEIKNCPPSIHLSPVSLCL